MILEQQVSLDSARATYDRLKNYLGTVTTTSLLKLNAEEWRQCAVSRQKARYISLLCQKVEDGSFDFDDLTSMDDDQARDYLTQLVGVGPWTANVYLLFCLQRPDVWPSGDIALINMIKEMYDIPQEDVDAFVKRWQPHRSLAAYSLWHRYLTDRKRTVYYD
jgi:DNA-3-methyladenine glycosylase II